MSLTSSPVALRDRHKDGPENHEFRIGRKATMTVTFSEEFLAESIDLLGRLGRRGDRGDGTAASRTFARVVGGSSYWASEARPDTRPTPSTTSGKSAVSKPTRPLTTCRSSPHERTTKGGTPRSSSGCEGRVSDPADAILVFSVGGGDAERGVSVNIVRAIDLAVEVGAAVFGVVGRDGGHTAQRATACVVVPPLFPKPGDAAHRGPLRGDLASVGVAPGACASRRTKWESI